MRWWMIAVFAACWSSNSPPPSPGPPPPHDAIQAVDARTPDGATPGAAIDPPHDPAIRAVDARTPDGATAGAAIHAAIVTCPPAYNTPGACAVPQAMACTYPQGTCFCMPVCPGGALVQPSTRPPPPHWECSPPPPITRADGCPGKPPHAGDPCKAPKQCSYGADTTGICWGFTLACSSTGWIAIPQAPPPVARPR